VRVSCWRDASSRQQLMSGRRWHGHISGCSLAVMARPSKSQAASAPALRMQSRGCRRRAHQETRAPRARWPVAVASECASTGTPRRQFSQLFAAIPCSLAWHGMRRGRSQLPPPVLSPSGGEAIGGGLLRAMPVSPDPCTGREHCTAPPGARAHTSHQRIISCLHWHHRFRYVGWLVRVHSPAKFLFFI